MITEELYEKYKKLAYKVAMPYLRGFLSIADDLEAAALLGLCEGLVESIKLNHPNPGALVVLHVKFELVKCLQSSYCIIKIPRSLVRKKKLEAYLKKEEFSIAKLYPEIFPLVEQETDQQQFYNYIGWEEIKQQISEIHLSEIEEKVLVYRLSDYTYMEIAQELGCSDVWVVKLMKKVREKWLKKIK